MRSIFKYTVIDLLRNRWTVLYFSVFLLITMALFMLSSNPIKVIASLSNINLALVPLVCLLLGSLYYYASKEYIQLLLAQPIARWRVFMGIYLGLGISLSLAPLLGILIPFLFMSNARGSEIVLLLFLLLLTLLLTFIFLAIAFVISLLNDNKLKGLGLCLFAWIFFAFLYDGIFLLALIYFKDYPLEKPSIVFTLLNPIDMARIYMLLKLDASAMLGYTGAVLKKFFGSGVGSSIILASLSVWMFFPVYLIHRFSRRKDF